MTCKLSFVNGMSYSNHIRSGHEQLPTHKTNQVKKRPSRYSDDQQMMAEDFSVSYPKSASNYFTYALDVQCKGCGRKGFKRSHKRCNEPEYYIHCIKKCEAYRKLGKTHKHKNFTYISSLDVIEHCFECKLSFINRSSRLSHMKSHHCDGRSRNE